jgi:hypothetical protein
MDRPDSVVNKLSPREDPCATWHSRAFATLQPLRRATAPSYDAIRLPDQFPRHGAALVYGR